MSGPMPSMLTQHVSPRDVKMEMVSEEPIAISNRSDLLTRTHRIINRNSDVFDMGIAAQERFSLHCAMINDNDMPPGFWIGVALCIGYLAIADCTHRGMGVRIPMRKIKI